MAAIGPNHIKELPSELETKCIMSLVARGIEVHRLQVPIEMSSAELRALASEVANAASVCQLWRAIAQPVLNKLKDVYDRKKQHETLTEILNAPRSEEQRTAFDARIEALGGREAFYNFPILDLQGRTGSTQYIDFVTPDFFVGRDTAVMTGVDVHNRPFFSLLLCPKEITEEMRRRLPLYYTVYPRGEFVVTVFQRFTDNPRWMPGVNTAPLTVPDSIPSPGDLALLANNTHPTLRLMHSSELNPAGDEQPPAGE